MWWLGFGEVHTDSGNKIWFSGDENSQQHGVAFLVRKEILGCAIFCTTVSSRIISIWLSAQVKNITIILVYGPTCDYSDEEVEEIYDTITKTFKLASKKDIIIVLGVWNSKVGPDSYKQ